MAVEFRQYPAPPPGSPGTPDPRADPGFYQVVQGGEVVAAYDSAHYPSLEAVVADLLARRRCGDAPGTPGEDYGIWRGGRPVGAIRRKRWGPQEPPPADGPDARKPAPVPPGEGESPGRIRIADSIRDDYRAA